MFNKQLAMALVLLYCCCRLLAQATSVHQMYLYVRNWLTHTCAVRSLKASNSRCSCTFCLFSAAHWSAISCNSSVCAHKHNEVDGASMQQLLFCAHCR